MCYVYIEWMENVVLSKEQSQPGDGLLFAKQTVWNLSVRGGWAVNANYMYISVYVCGAVAFYVEVSIAPNGIVLCAQH